MEENLYGRPRIVARIREFRIPPLQDGLILGRDASIGCIAIRKALDLLTAYRFTHIEPEDEVVGDIIVREHFLRRVSREELVSFVLREIKPLMSSDEILEIEMDVTVEIVARNRRA